MDQNTQQRIDDLVKQNDIVLFMKGNASFPMCGFSGRAIQILKASGVEPAAARPTPRTWRPRCSSPPTPGP